MLFQDKDFDEAEFLEGAKDAFYIGASPYTFRYRSKLFYYACIDPLLPLS